MIKYNFFSLFLVRCHLLLHNLHSCIVLFCNISCNYVTMICTSSVLDSLNPLNCIFNTSLFFSETLSVTAFHYIHTNLMNFHEMILSNKKEGVIWSRRFASNLWWIIRTYCSVLQNTYIRNWCIWSYFFFYRLHLALKAYSELLQNLNMMDRSKDEAIRNSAQVIKGNYCIAWIEYSDIK